MSGKKGKGRQPAPSPGPPAQEVQQARLRPVYNALDQKNYSKVLKLTNIEAKNEPICQWDLTKALRVVALDRSGRKRDALVQLQVVIGSGGCWYELNDHILQMDAGLPGSTSTSALTLASVLDPTVGFSAAASAPNSKSKGKKGKGKGKKAHPPSNPPNDLRSAQVSDLSQIDLVDLLDEPTWKRYMKVMGEAQKNVPEKEIIVDDVVLATLKVSLLSFHLNDTLARLYARAADALGSSPGANKEELCSILQESYFAHLRLMCTFPRTAHVFHTHNKDISNGASTRRIWQADRVCEALETAQLSAMTLAKHTGSRLHLSWVANAALMQREANLDAAKLMKARLSTSETTSDKASAVLHDKISKLEGKAAMLPRLAESLMGRVVSRPEGSEQEHPPSAEDWQLYIRSLTEQDRFEDALEQLEGIECASGSSENEVRRIDDQTDVTSHDGSLIQLALREKLELKASLCLGLKRYDDAVEVYEQLMQLHPDNWAYWKGLLKSSLSPNASDEQLANGLIHCQKSVQSYVEHESPALDLKTLHKQRGQNGQIINGYFRIKDLWDEEANTWVPVAFAQQANRSWIRTPAQARDYNEIIRIINLRRPEWITKLQAPQEPLDTNSWVATLTENESDDPTLDREIEHIIKVSKITNTHVEGTIHTYDHERILKMTERHTTFNLKDVTEIKVHRSSNGYIFEGLTCQAEMTRDKLSWGEGKHKFTMADFTVKKLREHVCITKVKGTEINSLKKWGEKYPNKNIPWKLIWKSLKNNWIDKKAASLQYKLIHLVKRAKYAVKPCECPRRGCQRPQADYFHTCFQCPTAKKYWKRVSVLTRMIGAEETKLTLLNLITGLPDIKNANSNSKTKQASIVWTCIHTTALRCIWNSWCSHVHEAQPFNYPYLMRQVTKSLKDRILQLWNRSKRKDKSNKNDEASIKFKEEWCLNNTIQIINLKVMIDLEANHKAAPTTTGTGSNTNNQQPQRATRTANTTQTNQHNNTSTPTSRHNWAYGGNLGIT